MSSFKLDMKGLVSGLAETQIKAQAALNLFGETAGKKLEAEAKRNYPWTDRSYMASKTLNGSYEWAGTTLRVKLEHGMDYGIYLEYCNEGKYAILWPTINSQSTSIMKGLNGILGR